ncbi:MAG: DUF1501 domain-containing protein [Calditrichia bacterium]
MISRRVFLKISGLALFSTAVGGPPVFLQRAVHAAENYSGYRCRQTLVAIFQRGGMDGLMAVSPLADPLLSTMRPRLFVSPTEKNKEQALIDLGGRFGWHPAFQPLVPLFQENRLAIVHCVGSPDKTRSHFDARDYMESGTPGQKGTTSGWLNRAAGLTGHEASPFRAVSLTAALPRSLYGSEPALAIEDLNSFRLDAAGNNQANADIFKRIYSTGSAGILRSSAQESFDALKVLSRIQVKKYKPGYGARYPHTPLGRNLKQIALFIKSDLGLEIAFAESGGWDTHVQQGNAQGTFARHAQDLANAVAAFWKDLGSYQDNVVLITMTEFGRTVRENGSGGTDHGRASCMFVLGNTVDGGKVHGSFPGKLEVDTLEDGRDLPVTTDFRALFTGVAAKHLNISDTQKLFPGWKGEGMEILKNG